MVNIGIGICPLRPHGSSFTETGGEPGVRVAIRLWRMDAAVEMDHCGDAAVLGGGSGYRCVPREDVGLREMVFPCHIRRDPLDGFNGRAGDARGCSRRAKCEYIRRREISVEFLFKTRDDFTILLKSEHFL